MSDSHDKAHYWRTEKSVWIEFYWVEFKEFDYFEDIDFKGKAVFVWGVQVGDKGIFII